MFIERLLLAKQCAGLLAAGDTMISRTKPNQTTTTTTKQLLKRTERLREMDGQARYGCTWDGRASFTGLCAFLSKIISIV